MHGRQDILNSRRRTAADAAEVASWLPDADALYLFTGHRLTWPLTVEQLTDLESIEGLTAWVVDRADRTLVGHFDSVVAGDVARLGRVIVNPALRGQRFAGRVVDLALARARDLGASAVRLNVISHNSPAIKTYLRAGFELESTSEKPDMSVMSKRLA